MGKVARAFAELVSMIHELLISGRATKQEIRDKLAELEARPPRAVDLHEMYDRLDPEEE